MTEQLLWHVLNYDLIKSLFLQQDQYKFLQALDYELINSVKWAPNDFTAWRASYGFDYFFLYWVGWIISTSYIRCLTSDETSPNGLAINLTAATSDLAINSNRDATLSTQKALAKLMPLQWSVPSSHYMVHRQLCGFMEGLLVFCT